MKTFAIIFGVYIMYLAILPGLNLIVNASTSGTETCCTESCGPGEQAPVEEPGEDNQGCNPFQSCYCCIGFSVDSGFHPLTIEPIYTRSYLHTTEQVPPSLTIDFWQPPKIT